MFLFCNEHSYTIDGGKIYVRLDKKQTEKKPKENLTNKIIGKKTQKKL